MMKRYNITAETVPGNDTWAESSRIEIDEADNGEWVRYKDALDVDRRLQYAGAIGLLCDLSVQVDEETREMIQQAADDFCKITGWKSRRILDRIEVEPA